MSENVHERAVQLTARARVEGLPEADVAWLREHVESCDFCAEHARQTDRALRLLRTSAIPLPEGLASRTQFRVRLRAQELLERGPRHQLMWVICGVSWALGVATAPYVWHIFKWVGEHTGVPKLVWEIGFGLWWAIPAVFVAIVMLMENARQSKDASWLMQSR
jgi:hypothetical protein